MESNHSVYLQMAIQEASISSDQALGYPFGCVIVKDGKIIAQAHNEIFSQNDPNAQAEVLVIKKAQQILNSRTFEKCTLYCSSEPNMVSRGAIYLANFQAVYYAMCLQELKNIIPQICD